MGSTPHQRVCIGIINVFYIPRPENAAVVFGLSTNKRRTTHMHVTLKQIALFCALQLFRALMQRDASVRCYG